MAKVSENLERLMEAARDLESKGIVNFICATGQASGSLGIVIETRADFMRLFGGQNVYLHETVFADIYTVSRDRIGYRYSDYSVNREAANERTITLPEVDAEKEVSVA